MQINQTNFGVKDSSYKAAGELAGITKLVDSFYDYMNKLPEAKAIRAMHPEDLTISREKLTYFLSGWLGGPRLYRENYGPISIPQVHGHLKVGEQERDAWLLCMEKAADDQAPYSDAFKKYLLEQLFVPADRVRVVSGNRIK